jgi:hypothetical protein
VESTTSAKIGEFIKVKIVKAIPFKLYWDAEKT